MIGNGSCGHFYPRFAYVILKMATGILRAVISNVLESTPALSNRSSQLHRWGKEILERSTKVEQTAFNEFSERLVSYVRERINAVCEGVTMDRSKRFKIWSDSHQARLDNSGPIHSAWIELLKKLSITGAEDDPLLEQSVNSELYGMLIAENLNGLRILTSHSVY